MAKSGSLQALGQYLSGNVDEALKWHIATEKLNLQLKDTPALAYQYAEMCVMYLKLKKYDEAREVIDRSITYAHGTTDLNLLATAYNDRGLYFNDTKQPDSALASYQKAYGYYKTLNSEIGMSYSLDYMAAILTEKGKTIIARQYLEESKELRARNNDKMGEAIAINNIGEILMREKKYKDAVTYFVNARDKAAALKFIALESYAYKMEADAYSKLGQYDKAFEALENHRKTNEKELNEKQIKVVEEMQAKYETDKKQQENKLLHEKTQVQALEIRQRNIAILGLLIAPFLISGVAFLLYQRYKLKQEAKLQEQLLLQQKLRAQAIMETEEHERQRLARELHDGVGQLLSASRRKIDSGINDEQAKKDTLSLLDESIKEVRELSHNMMPPALVNKSLMQAIEDMAERIRSATGLDIQVEAIDIEDLELSKTETLMLYRAVQEMLSNVVKHANATLVTIDIVNHETELNLMVYDNGMGFDKAMVMQQGGGLGLKNIQSRIEYIGGHIEIDTMPGKGTTYIIDVPIKEMA